jgi:hypothetical protein
MASSISGWEDIIKINLRKAMKVDKRLKCLRTKKFEGFCDNLQKPY